MIFRKIRPQEVARTIELFSTAFECDLGKRGAAQESAEKKLSNPENKDDYEVLERWAAFKDDDSTMTAYISGLRYAVNFDGNMCSMRGIGGVSSLPQYRRNGAIRGCFMKAFEDFYNEGCVFSYLYPFSNAFYRQFGYERGCEVYSYKADFRSLRDFASQGEYVLLENGDEKTLGDVRKVYADFCRKYNMCAVREDCDWFELKNTDIYTDCRYTYVYRNEAGEAMGYCTFEKSETNGERNLKCRELAFSDLSGLNAMLDFLRGFASHFKFLIFDVPDNLDISYAFKENSLYEVTCTKIPYGMARVINVEKALKLAKYKGEGKAVIKVDDPQIPDNSASWKVEFAGGNVTVSKTEESPDADMPIQAFSRLLLGFAELDESSQFMGVKVFGNEENLHKIFYRKPTAIFSGF